MLGLLVIWIRIALQSLECFDTNVDALGKVMDDPNRS